MTRANAIAKGRPLQDLLHRSVADIAKRIRARAASAVEVVEACVTRIEAVNDDLNAVVQLDVEHALAEASRCDALLRNGQLRGPLHGVPMTIKDSFETAGLTTTAGTTGLTNSVPTRDATVVARLRESGAILLGKTNTPELTLRFSTDNFVYGRTNNPFDRERIPGGSSGGAAAIVAVGGSPFDVGTDTAGSIRIPAHFCGVAGLKPTAGRVSRAGHIPFLEFGATEALTQVGPIARYVDDLTLILSIIAGSDARDPLAVPMPLADPHEVHLDQLRGVWYVDDGYGPADGDTSKIVKAAAEALSTRMASVKEGRPPGTDKARDLWRDLMTSDGGATVSSLLESLGTESMHPFLDWTKKGDDVPTSKYVRTLAHWNEYRAAGLAYMETCDVVIVPVTPGPAPKHDEPTPFHFTQAFNLLGWPAAVVRCGTSSAGLPIGVQIIAGPWREDVVLAVAKILEIEFGGWESPTVTHGSGDGG